MHIFNSNNSLKYFCIKKLNNFCYYFFQTLASNLWTKHLPSDIRILSNILKMKNLNDPFWSELLLSITLLHEKNNTIFLQRNNELFGSIPNNLSIDTQNDEIHQNNEKLRWILNYYNITNEYYEVKNHIGNKRNYLHFLSAFKNSNTPISTLKYLWKVIN